MTKFVLLLVATSGCYFYYPRIPKHRVAKVDGATVTVVSEADTYQTSCKPGEAGCTFDSMGNGTRDYGVHVVTTTYDGKEVSQFDLQSIVDPEFDRKLAAVKSKKALCNVSLVPSAIAVVGVLGLLYAVVRQDSLGDDVKTFRYASLGVAVGGAVLSAPLGGFACWQAKTRFDAMFPVDAERSRFRLHRSGAHESGRYYDEMKRLGDAYNAQFGSSAVRVRPTLDMRSRAGA